MTNTEAPLYVGRDAYAGRHSIHRPVGSHVEYRDRAGVVRIERVVREGRLSLELESGAVLAYPFRNPETIFVETGTRWPQ